MTSERVYGLFTEDENCLIFIDTGTNKVKTMETADPLIENFNHLELDHAFYETLEKDRNIYHNY